ncbi:PKS-NRPS hybrid [Colletotrichum higginsianum IMI 349063]|uniref:PKS-NRPS hybrid n=1 Tax=Colletotrichum higginsianum (strain IMI 349063) TaxID=759273 RepID=A0A1B7XQE4_COLHI|nr:PKS-NRPS hybrid [Colletotrichum higginsianum IMI 349063]OBR01985.1 PKS-NRPS hybrid [Colletotrichum higginsianum IMI 349063]
MKVVSLYPVPQPPLHYYTWHTLALNLLFLFYLLTTFFALVFGPYCSQRRSPGGSLIRATYTKCKLDLKKPEDRLQYFETHGTGTPSGDPVEAEAIQRVFFPGDDTYPADGAGAVADPSTRSFLLHVRQQLQVRRHQYGHAIIESCGPDL